MFQPHHAQRILQKAKEYIHDAELLSGSNSLSDASAIIATLAMELLLKCAVYCETGTKPGSHEYSKIWSKLPLAARDKILTTASIESNTSVNAENIKNVLDDLGKVFTKARYSYEIDMDEHRTADQITKRSAAWVEQGAPSEDADFRYRPLECFGLTRALEEFVEAKLSVLARSSSPR